MTRTEDKYTYCNYCSIFPPNILLSCIYRIIKWLKPPLTHPGYLSPPYLPAQRYLHWNNQRGARLLHWSNGLSWNLKTFCVADISAVHKSRRVNPSTQFLYCCRLRTKESSAEGGSRRAAPPTDELCQEKNDRMKAFLTQNLYCVSPETAGGSSARFMRSWLLFLLSVSCLSHRPVSFPVCPIAARHRTAAARWRHCCGLGPGSSFVCLTRLPVVFGVEAQRKSGRTDFYFPFQTLKAFRHLKVHCRNIETHFICIIFIFLRVTVFLGHPPWL